MNDRDVRTSAHVGGFATQHSVVQSGTRGQRRGVDTEPLDDAAAEGAERRAEVVQLAQLLAA